MTRSRTILGVLCVAAAAATVVSYTALAYALAHEYGLSPNGSLLIDSLIALANSVPVLLVIAALTWAGLRLAAAPQRRYAGRIAAAAIAACLLLGLGGAVAGDQRCQESTRPCGPA